MSKNCPKCGTQCQEHHIDVEPYVLYFCNGCEMWVDNTINLDEIRSFMDMMEKEDTSAIVWSCVRAIRAALDLDPEPMRKIGKEYRWSFYQKSEEI